MKEVKYKYNKYILEDYFLAKKTIVINQNKKFSYNYYYFNSHMLKINDYKFCLTTSNYYLNELYIITFDLYSAHDTNLCIRHYNIPLKLYNLREYKFIMSFNFYGFYGLVYTTEDIQTKRVEQYLSIFSYINGIDSEIISLDSNTILNLNDYINSNFIENNLFGLCLNGIKIISLPCSKDLGVYYFSEQKNNIVLENEILNINDKISFVFDYDNLITNNLVYTIELAGIVKEPSYSELNKYPIFTENYGDKDQESFYSPRILTGKTCFYNFTIKNSLSGENINSCGEYCKVCYKNKCIKCIDNYILMEDSNTCHNKQINNYFLDTKNNLLRKCHESCLLCSNGPIYSINSLDIEDTNCEVCIDNYYKIINTNNCIHKDNTPIGYYLDTDKNLFLSCYEKCLTCSKYKQNLTSLNCLSCDENSIFYEHSHNCLDCVLRGKYVNYFQYDCIDSIPDGYYLLKDDDKTIDTCYFTCKHCNEKGNSENHKCTECFDAYPYNFNNGQKCLDDFFKENLMLDEIDKKCYEDCNNNLNERKYSYKNKCIGFDEQPQNCQLDNNNNFISICIAQSKYEFNGECYDNCPEGTKIDESLPNKNICTCNNLYYLKEEKMICVNSNVCPEEYPYIRIGSSECTNCPVKYKDECYIYCPEDTCITQINSKLETCVDRMELTEIFGGICFNDFPLILDYIDNINSSSGQVISINSSPGVTLSIYENGLNLENNKDFYNLTIINLDNCKSKLMEYYQLNSTDTLYIFSLDSISKKSNQIFNDINFKIYLNKGKELDDLYICYDTPISISTPIVNEDIINFDYAVYFYEQGYDIYNLDSSFYNDICTSISIDNSDMILKDRLEYIFPTNVTSFCPDDCILNETDIKNKRINCICDIYFSAKNKLKVAGLNILGLEIDKQKLLDSLSLKTLNFGILKCFKVLTKDNLIHNIGNYVLLFSILIYIIGIITFYISINFNFPFTYFIFWNFLISNNDTIPVISSLIFCS